MQDIIILFFLLRYMSRLAIQKNQPVNLWRFYTLAGWFIGGLIGSMIAQSFYHLANPMDLLKEQNVLLLTKVMIFYYLFAVMGYHIVRTILKNKPDAERPNDGSIL